jgi:hypothetical protein
MTHDTNFRIVPLPHEVAQAARQARRDAFGNALTVLRDGQPHQCRVCLQLSLAEEGVILLAYRPFPSNQPYAEVGPIFVHEQDCDSYQDVWAYPPGFPRKAVVLRAYNDREQIVGAQAVGERRVEEVIKEMFDDQGTTYLHARNLGYGCYMFRIDRA